MVEGESDETMFQDDKYDAARTFLVINLCQFNLHIPPSQIIIESVRSAEKISSGILWVKAPSNFVRFLFTRAAEVRDDMVEVMQFTPGPAISRKRTLEKRLTNIRESAPRGTIYTQLRPGKYDYTLWMKIMRPNGSGRYERRDLSEIDPEKIAPKLEVKFPRPTPEYQEQLNNLSERSRKTLNSISEAGNSISVDTVADSREDVEGFKKHSNKRNRSSP